MNSVFSISDYGATADGATVCTAAIQAAVDRCSESGGGTVLVPAGMFVTGTVELKSNVMLELSPGATLLASRNPEDYRRTFPRFDGVIHISGDTPFNMDQFLIYALHARDTGICGTGTIDARGGAFYRETSPGKWRIGKWRPGPTVCLIDCDEIRLRNFTLRDNPMFGIALMQSRGAILRGLRISTNPGFVNGDGIHVKSSRDIVISDCIIDSQDDALCFYSDYWDWGGTAGLDRLGGDCSDVTVSNCILSSTWSGIRMGYTGSDAVSNLIFSGIIVKQAYTALDFICNGGCSGFGGLAKNYSGARIEKIAISNFRARNTVWGIRMNVQPDVGSRAGIQDILFSGIGLESKNGCYLAGTAEHPIRNVTFRDFQLTVTGKTGEFAEVPEPLPVFIGDRPFQWPMLLKKTEDVRFFNSTIQTADGRISSVSSEGTLPESCCKKID